MNITLKQLKALSNPNIIDIRSSQSYNMGHIEDAKNIEYMNLLINPALYLDKNQNYYIYCTKGITSQNLTNILNNQGYKTISIIGVYNAYKNLKTY